MESTFANRICRTSWTYLKRNPLLLVFAPFALFFAFFAAMWTLSLTSIAYIGGWARLAGIYPAKGPAMGEHFSFCSAQFGLFASYSNSLNVTVSSAGIHMQPFYLLGAGHDPIFIPWHAVLECRQRGFWFIKSVKLVIRLDDHGARKTIHLHGRGLAKSLLRWSKR